MQGYRTIIALVVQLAVSLGYLSQADSSSTVDALFTIVSAVITLVGVYYKVQANIREKKLNEENEMLFLASSQKK